MTRRRRTVLLMALTGVVAAALPVQAQEDADDLIHSRPTGAFPLTPDWSLQSYADKLQTAVGTTTSVTAVLRDANRDIASCNSAQQHSLPENYDRSDYPLSSRQILRSSEKFCWDPGDSKIAYWIPQGVTGSADADKDGLWDDNRVMLVSWYYDESASNKGVRISFVDMKNRKYRHVLLVEPTKTTTPDYNAVPIHAGGIAWLNNYLYVADTKVGLRVFDMERILEVSDAQDSIGKSGNTYYAHNYKYVLPQVATYRQPVLSTDKCDPTARRLCFSSLSVDRSTTPDTLVVGEYRDGRDTNASVDGGRVVRYQVDASTRLPVLTNGKAVPHDVVTMPRSNVQGVQTWKGTYYLGRSSSRSHSWMYSGSVGGSTNTRSWAIGGEDLYHEHGPNETAGRLWTVAEHAWSLDRTTFIDRRAIFAVPLSSIG
jgi:hypothetical protein